MQIRTRTRFSFFVSLAALTTAGCGVNQATRFQNSFLPAAPPAATSPSSDLPSPPEIKTSITPRDTPVFLAQHPQLPAKKTRGDELILQAEERFRRGRRFYQSADHAAARRDFDQAMDLMIEASVNSPADRQDYERRLEMLADAIHRFDLAGLGASVAVAEGGFEKAPLEDILPMTFPVDPKLKDKVREQVAATVSQLPLSVNDTVLGYINYFSSKRGHGTIVAGIRRSGRYRPMIQRILDEEGVPQELIHLAQAESGFIPRAKSRMAAVGMWQFVAFRGKEYGLDQTRYIDERMDPEKATRAAARHLHDLYNMFGDWYLAIAAYNCGPGTVLKAVERTGYADFWELRRRGVLPAETTNYVPIILAMTIMEKNAPAYGLTDIQMDPPVEYDTVETTAPTSLSLVADITDTPMAELASLNPAVLKGLAPEKAALRVPKGTGNLLASRLESVPAGHRDSWRLHRVGADESLPAIAKRYGASANAIVTANNMASPEAVEGDHLLIPVALRAEAPVRETRPAVRSTRRAPRSTAASARSKSKTPAKPAAVSSNRTKKAPVIVAHSK